MLFFLLLLVVLMVTDMEIAPLGAYQEDYMSRKQNNCIKGIFILLILMSHYTQYCDLGGPFDAAYWAARMHIGQGVVAMFLFYSGYGMMESIRKKGFPYVRRIPVFRFLKVWWNFFLAVLCYLVMDLILQIHYPGTHILLSFVGYKSLGNSDWYMFAIFVLYLLTFLAFFLVKWKDGMAGYIAGTVLMFLLTTGAVYWEIRMGRSPWTYNTMLIYPLGMAFSLLRPKVEALLTKDGLIYGAVFLAVMLVYMYSYIHRGDRFMIYTVWVYAFTAAILLLTMKVSFKSWVLEWFGKNLFWVYILQRIPMILLEHFGMIDRHRYFCFVIVFITTICLTLLFDRTVGKATNDLFAKLDSRTAAGQSNGSPQGTDK